MRAGSPMFWLLGLWNTSGMAKSSKIPPAVGKQMAAPRSSEGGISCSGDNIALLGARRQDTRQMANSLSPIIFLPGMGGEIPSLSRLNVAGGDDDNRFEAITYSGWQQYTS